MGDFFMSIKENIEKAGRERKLIRIKAKKIDGTHTERVCEPYSFRRTNTGIIFYFFCRLRNNWRSLRLNSIYQVEILEEKFEPREAVEF